MEILLQQNYHTIITDIQQQLDSKEAQITNLSEQTQRNGANMQAQEAEIQELRMKVQTQRVEIQALQAELQEKSKDLQNKTRDLQDKTKDLQDKTKDLQDKTNEFLEQRLQMQKELNDKTVGLANCIKEIESIKTNLAANQEKLQATMTLPYSQNNSEKGHKLNGDSQLIGSSNNANEAEEVLPYIPITSTNKMVRLILDFLLLAIWCIQNSMKIFTV